MDFDLVDEGVENSCAAENSEEQERGVVVGCCRQIQ